MSRRLVVEADGGSRGNPGPAGYGAVVRDADTGEVLAERAASIGRATNNVAEYCGLIEGLKLARDYGIPRIRVYMDSELVVDQVSGVSAVRQAHLRELHEAAGSLGALFASIRVSWGPREMKAEGDQLVRGAFGALRQR